VGDVNRFLSLAAPGLRGLAPYVPGKPPETVERELGIRGSIKLASNENPLGPGPRSRAALSAAIANVGHYPDGSGHGLRARIVRRFDFYMHILQSENWYAKKALLYLGSIVTSFFVQE
jgi:histidinol-phosphate/aromatic aminotransferase/cobyric acid decarboxylase-like protein